MDLPTERVTRAETVAALPLWYGVLAGPIAWGAQLILVFGLPEAVVCAPGSGRGSAFAGIGIETLIQVINTVAAVATALALVVAYRAYRRLAPADASEAGRARWMAAAGMFNSALFLILIAVKFAAPLALGPCGTSP